MLKDLVNKDMEDKKISESKYLLSDKNIRKLYEYNFKRSSNNIAIKTLSGGLKSAVYLIEDNKSKIVLKIAPKYNKSTISVDNNTLWWEVEMLKKMEEINFPSPKVLAYDSSCSICHVPYFFMTYLDGENYLEIKDKLNEEQQKQIEYEIGTLSFAICKAPSNQFFLPGEPQLKFSNNYEFIFHLFDLLLTDARNHNVDLGENRCKRIFGILEEKKDSINNIDNLCYVNTDMWDGNILIKDGHISGIVDFADIYCCDEIMTFYFHTIDGKLSESFLKGYNKSNLSYDEMTRIEIYRMYVILKMIIECKIKEYGRFDWMYDNLSERMKILNKTK